MHKHEKPKGALKHKFLHFTDFMSSGEGYGISVTE